MGIRGPRRVEADFWQAGRGAERPLWGNQMGFFGNAEETDIIKEEEFGSRIMRIKDRLGETQLQRALKDKQKKKSTC